MTNFCKCGCGTEIEDNRIVVDGHRNKIEQKEWIKEDVISKVKEIFLTKKLKKSDFWENYNLYQLPSMNVIGKLFGSLDNLALQADIVFEKRDRAKYLREHPEVLQKIMRKSNIFKKGYLYEERYGEKRAKEIKEKLSNKHKRML
jgi:hypothetical protein